ncbi:hypothetical protein BST27_30500 [Mycobacterium intermedium]|uniref:Uncharacterized protein n=1 Tax=Mycobacterium intermedium TaxID=28445 RepID=A0A1T3VRM0_MYCIE|nr:hypothetical protein BV508_31145 [Mycobacterium intermedium]ORA85812.1 hypothetical protein BST27_30500 [Mycobacterium intermedium]
MSTRSASILLLGSMIRASTRSRNTVSPLAAESKPKIRYAAHRASHKCVIRVEVIGNGAEPAGAVTSRSSTA